MHITIFQAFTIQVVSLRIKLPNPFHYFYFYILKVNTSHFHTSPPTTPKKKRKIGCHVGGGPLPLRAHLRRGSIALSPSLQLQPFHSLPPYETHPVDPLRASWNKVTSVAPFRWNRRSRGIDSGIPILSLMISFLITNLIFRPQRKALLAQSPEPRCVDY